MRKWSVKKQTEWANKAHNMLADLGVSMDGELMTIAGPMIVHPVLSDIEPWIHCQFDYPHLAVEHIHHGQLNPYSGKWNWMTSDIEYVREQITKILKVDQQ